MPNKEWSAKDAAKAWGVSEMRVRQIAPTIEGAHIVIVNGRTKWLLPQGAVKPANKPAGRKRKSIPTSE